jgi:hypothetical protein
MVHTMEILIHLLLGECMKKFLITYHHFWSNYKRKIIWLMWTIASPYIEEFIKYLESITNQHIS